MHAGHPWPPARHLLQQHQWQRTEETAAAGRSRLDPDLAPHLLHQLATDRKSEPGALGPRLTRLPALLKGQEQTRQQLGTDAGPLVIHSAQQLGASAAGPQHHLATGAELDGIGQQVVQHLLHPVGIQLYLGGQSMIEIQPQLQSLGAGLGPVHGRHVLA